MLSAQRRSIPRGEISHLGKTREREVLGCYPKMSLRRTGGLPARTRKIGRIEISLEELDRAWGRSTDREGEREHLFGIYSVPNLRLQPRRLLDHMFIRWMTEVWTGWHNPSWDYASAPPGEVKEWPPDREGRKADVGIRVCQVAIVIDSQPILPVNSTKWLLR